MVNLKNTNHLNVFLCFEDLILGFDMYWDFFSASINSNRILIIK